MALVSNFKFQYCNLWMNINVFDYLLDLYCYQTIKLADKRKDLTYHSSFHENTVLGSSVLMHAEWCERQHCVVQTVWCVTESLSSAYGFFYFTVCTGTWWDQAMKPAPLKDYCIYKDDMSV